MWKKIPRHFKFDFKQLWNNVLPFRKVFNVGSDKFLTFIYLSVGTRWILIYFFLFWCQRSVELNPTQKDLVLKIAELLCKNDVTDGRAKYWVERAAKLFPGSPAIYKLKVKTEQNSKHGKA